MCSAEPASSLTHAAMSKECDILMMVRDSANKNDRVHKSICCLENALPN